MPLAQPSPALSTGHSQQSLKRAECAFRCSPFQIDLLRDLRSHSIAIRQLCGPSGLQSGYVRRRLAELQADNEMMWLIAVGLLRREVDGQGLTDSFRLTPLGRQVYDNLALLTPAQYRPALADHLRNAWCRWLRRPSWWQG